MRKMTLLVVLIMIFGIAVGSRQDVETASIANPNAEVYFVDSSMLRLIPQTIRVGKVSRQKAAEKIIKELIAGRDENPKILRLIPKIKKGMTVKVKNNIAIVDMTQEFVDKHSGERTHEILTIYAIVNSLTSIDGIDNVKFTIAGQRKKEFQGFLDLRETFIPDYYI